MSQTKHQNLARELKQLSQECHKTNISLQLEPHIHPNTTTGVTYNVMTRLKPLKTMVKIYHYAFFYFKPNPKDFELLGLMNRGGCIDIVEKKQLDKSLSKPFRKFITWIALISYLEENSTRSLHDLQLDLCDLPLQINPFKEIRKESIQNSLFYQTQTLARYERQKPFIKMEYEKQKKQMENNLLMDASPIWEISKKTFQAPPSENSDPDAVIEIALNPRNLDSVGFAPQEGESIKRAYEKVLESIRNRKDQHRFVLRKIYKEELERVIFKDVTINKLIKGLPLIPLEWTFSEKTSKKQTNKLGRWKTSQVVDYQTMNLFFNHFYNTFILDPTNLKAGDISVIILIMVWIATLEKGGCVSIRDILNITSFDVNFLDRTLKIGKEIFPIPHWIFLLLRCYCSKKKQIRSHRLFKSLDIHGKALERAFHGASKELLGPEITPILPEAMMYLPHGYLEDRISKSELQVMRETRPLIIL